MIAPKKSLGQNFLHEETSILKIIDSLAISESDTIVEIGPGRGALTKHLLKRNPKQVIAIEKDDRMVTFLTDGLGRCISSGKLQIEHADFLDWQAPQGEFKLVGNIPFYITGKILRHVLDAPRHPSLMTLLMQKEVAERIVIADGKNSILGTAANVYCKPKIIGTVKPGAFFPSPKVMSAIVVCTEFHNPFATTEERCGFFNFVHQIFSGKRKTLATNLKNIYERPPVIDALKNHNQNVRARAEDLTTETILGLYRELNPQS